MAVKDSIGGWKDNAYILRTPNTCTTVKKLMGPAVLMVIQNFGLSENCPVVPVNILIIFTSSKYIIIVTNHTFFLERVHLKRSRFHKLRVEVGRTETVVLRVLQNSS